MLYTYILYLKHISPVKSESYSYLICGQLSAHVKLRYSARKEVDDAAIRKRKGKAKEGENDLEVQRQVNASHENRLATLDIFAGCGGLSEGLQLSGNISHILICYLRNAKDLILIRFTCKGVSLLTATSNVTGASATKWAIEYEEPAGDAFKLNHPEALVFINNCNVILRLIISLSLFLLFISLSYTDTHTHMYAWSISD